jgi:hypothetical protein
VLISNPNSKSAENLPNWLDREKGVAVESSLSLSLASDFRSGSGFFLFSFLCFSFSSVSAVLKIGGGSPVLAPSVVVLLY